MAAARGLGFVPYIGDLDVDVMRGGRGGGIATIISDTEPESPVIGGFWFKWDDPALFLRYDYETWIQIAPTMETPVGPPKEPPGPQPPGPGPGPGPTVPWTNDLTYSFPFDIVVIDGNPGSGQIPLNTLGNWDPAYAADFTDELLYTGPNRPTSPSNQVIRLFATFAAQPEVEVDFDLFGLGTSAPNKLTRWGYDSGANAVYIIGSNSTGNPIELRVEKA